MHETVAPALWFEQSAMAGTVGANYGLVDQNGLYGCLDKLLEEDIDGNALLAEPAEAAKPDRQSRTAHSDDGDPGWIRTSDPQLRRTVVHLPDSVVGQRLSHGSHRQCVTLCVKSSELELETRGLQGRAVEHPLEANPSFANLAQTATVQGSMTARPAAMNALASRDATAKSCEAAIAAM